MVSGSRSGVSTLGANCLLPVSLAVHLGGACCRGMWALGPGMVSLGGEERARLHRCRATRAVYQGTARRPGRGWDPAECSGNGDPERAGAPCPAGEDALPVRAIAGCDVMRLGE